MRSRASHILIAFVITSSLSAAQSMYDTYSGFTVPATPVLPAAEVHPSLYFGAADLPDLKGRKSLPAYSSIWSSITSNINSYKSKTASALNYIERPRMAKYCAFGWIMNNDATALAKAIEALMIAYDNVPRTENSSDFDKPYDEIYRATWIQSYCEAYDWVQPSLTNAQDSTIRAKIGREAEILCNKVLVYSARPHNHRSKPAYGYGTAALTLSSDSRASGWLSSSLTMLNTVTKYQFSSDGIYREGAHYYIYSIVNEIPFLWHYKNVSGVDLFPYYKASFEWPVLIRDQRGWMPNNEDGNVKPAPTHMVAKAYLNTPTRLHSTEPLARIFQWNWATTKFFTTAYTGATDDICWDIDEFITYDSTIPSVQPDVDPTLKLATGQVVFRNGWSNTDSTMRYLLYLAAAAADNHDHPDELSYIVNARNTCMAVDGGYGQDFPNHTSWYLAPLSHNLVTINGDAPEDFGVNLTPPDRHFLSTPFVAFSEKEAMTSAAGGKIRRGIVFVDKDYWVVCDLPVSTNAATSYKLNVHSRGTLSRTDAASTWSIASDSKYGSAARLHSYITGSGATTFANKTGNTCLFKDSVAQSYVEATQTGDSVAFMHSLVTTASGIAAPSTTEFQGLNLKALESIPRAGVTDLFTVRLRAGMAQAGLITEGVPGGWMLRTDAVFGWMRRSASTLKQFLVNEATSLQWNMVEVLHVSAPLTIAGNMNESGRWRLYVDSVCQATTVWVNTPGTSAVTMNGAALPFTNGAGGTVSFSLTKPGVIEILFSGTDVPNEGRLIPLKTQLFPNFPNPFNPTTAISYQVSAISEVKISVFDLLGREVTVLVNGVIQPGLHTVAFDASALPSGTYLIVLRTPETTLSQRAILSK